MVPDTVLRLAAVQKALEDIIRPVLPEGAGFAQEQLALIIKSIALVRKQIPHEYAVHVHDAHAFSAFARDLAPLVPAVQHDALLKAIAQVDAVAPASVPDRIALEDSVRSLRGAIETAISEAAADTAVLEAIGPIVIAHTERQTLLERRWVVDTGFDPAPASLPSIEEAVYGAPKGEL